MSTAFLAICTLLALFISLSGITNPIQLAFLPVTLYLVAALIQRLFRRGYTPDFTFKGRKLQLTILALMFIPLFGLGLKSVSRQKILLPTPNPLVLSVPQPTSTPTLPSVTLTITHPDPQALVNVRELPASDSAILGKVPVGAVFPLLDSTPLWYQISYASSSGWIFSQYATLSGQLP